MTRNAVILGMVTIAGVVTFALVGRLVLRGKEEPPPPAAVRPVHSAPNPAPKPTPSRDTVPASSPDRDLWSYMQELEELLHDPRRLDSQLRMQELERQLSDRVRRSVDDTAFLLSVMKARSGEPVAERLALVLTSAPEPMEVELLNLLRQDSPASMRKLGALALATRPSTASRQALVDALEDEDTQIRLAVCRALQRRISHRIDAGPDRRDVGKILKHVITDDPAKEVRVAAIHTVGAGHKIDSETKWFLHRLSQSNEDEEIRSNASFVLTRSLRRRGKLR